MKGPLTSGLELFIADHGTSLAIGLAVFGLVALGTAGWVAATPDTVTITEEHHDGEIEIELGTSAVVTGENDLWEVGTELEDSPVYLRKATSELTLHAETHGPDDPRVTVIQELSIEITASRDGEVFWVDEERLVREEQAVEDETTVTETIDIDHLDERLGRIEDSLDGAGTLDTNLVYTVEYDADDYAGTLSDSAPLVLTENSFRLGGDPSDAERLSTTISREEPGSPDWTTAGLLALLGLISVASAGTTVVVGRHGIDREAALLERQRFKFDEWISNGSVPMWLGDHHIRMDTLQDVVDVAIDRSQRVVHDPDREIYAVIDDNVVYYFCLERDWDHVRWPDVGQAFDGESFDDGSVGGNGFGAAGFDDSEFDPSQLPKIEFVDQSVEDNER